MRSDPRAAGDGHASPPSRFSSAPVALDPRIRPPSLALVLALPAVNGPAALPTACIEDFTADSSAPSSVSNATTARRRDMASQPNQPSQSRPVGLARDLDCAANHGTPARRSTLVARVRSGTLVQAAPLYALKLPPPKLPSSRLEPAAAAAAAAA